MVNEQTPRTTLTDIAGWKLGKTLGRGAYAHVRLATHSSGRRSACKILPALHQARSSPVTWDETVDAVEAHKEVVLLKALAGAGTKGVVGLEGVVEHGGWTYVFLTLHEHSLSSIPTPWKMEVVAPFMRRLCQTIHSLHLLGISHEDLKRSNVLLDDSMRPIVVDFGFSHFSPKGGQVRSLGGTLEYSSPEKVEDHLYDPRANDVWALGILLVKLLGLPHPFSNPDKIEKSHRMKQRIIHADPSFPWQGVSVGPGSLGALLYGMLDKDPATRYTLPEILRHPALGPPSLVPSRLPQLKLPIDFPSVIPMSILEDVAFLAYLNKAFFLCESYKQIKEKILGPNACWEKRWAGLLSKWKQKTDLEWDDVPLQRSKAISVPHSRVLREIHLSPNRQHPMQSRAQPAKSSSNAIKPLQKSRDHKAGQAHANPRKSLISNMRAKEETTSIRSHISVYVSKRSPPVFHADKKLKTPVRVDFGRKRKTVIMPKAAPKDIDNLKTLGKHLDNRGSLPPYVSGGESAAAGEYEGELEPLLKEAEGVLSSAKASGTGRKEEKSRQLAPPPMRRSKRIQAKQVKTSG